MANKSTTIFKSWEIGKKKEIDLNSVKFYNAKKTKKKKIARLTERDDFGNADIIGVDSVDWQLCLRGDELNRVTAAINRLATFEEGEEAGKLFFLKYVPGDVVYIVNGGKVVKAIVSNICLSSECQILYNICEAENNDTTYILDSKHIFSTRKEAKIFSEDEP